MPILQNLVDQREQAVDGALRAAAAAAQRFTDGGDDPLVGPPGGAGGAGGAVVEQPPQALLLVGQAHALHRGAPDASEPESGQLLGLGLLPLGQRVLFRVVLRPYRPVAAWPAGQAAFDFSDVPLPGQCFLARRGGGGLEQAPLRGGLGGRRPR
ncbi:hypothetical protein ABZ307_34680 [Streptomyces griseorubiginosus]|uniref:hypothetical protein n=1 Tax=Streptomyces griseorubiginosus TaxID=67304 RepID=UPI0033BA21E7